MRTHVWNLFPVNPSAQPCEPQPSNEVHGLNKYLGWETVSFGDLKALATMNLITAEEWPEDCERVEKKSRAWQMEKVLHDHDW